MESSEEDDDFPTHEWITPQSSINSIYQSHTEKGIRKICSELLELKDAVENLSGNMQSKYLAFLRLSEEVVEMEQELIDLQKHVSAQGILVQDLMSGVCRELEVWNKCSSEESNPEEISVINKLLHDDIEDPKITFLETIDVLLAEHKLEEAISAIIAEEKKSPELCDLGVNPSVEGSSYRLAFLKKKDLLVDKIVRIAEQPYIGIPELRKAASGLVKLGKGSLALKLMLNACDSHLQKKIEAFLPQCAIYSETYTAILSQLVFSTISVATKECTLIVGDIAYMNRIVQWAEDEIESFVRLVKENSPSPETAAALRSSSVCIQASLSHCSTLESQGLKFSKLTMVLLRPHIEEVLDMNFRQARRRIIDLTKHDNVDLLDSQLHLPLSVAAPTNIIFSGIGKKFMSVVEDILDQLTPMVILHFGGNILTKLLQLFDKFIESLIKTIPGPSEDDNLIEQKESEYFKAETDAEQLRLLGTAYTVALELLPLAVSKIVSPQNENKESGSSESMSNVAVTSVEYKDWKRHLQHSLDKLRDHFCRQYVLTFIYSREGKAKLDARIYLEVKGEDLFWDSEPLPSLPFRGLFGRLQQLASVAGDVLLGKEKIQKVLLSRLTETVVMWLSDENEFWDVFEDESVQLQPLGLQQLTLDMHFIVEIAVCGGYSSRNVNQLVSAVITRAIGTFSARGIDPQSALPEDEWFVDTAKSAISKLMHGTSESEISEADDHIVLMDDISDSDESLLSPSLTESADSFASANMGEIDSPVYFTDPEA